MSALQRWAATYAAYDDATLEALAGAGPVRRAAKDVAAGRVSLASAEADAATLDVDGTTVALDAGGPASARCGCPAAGTCKHVLAAVMWLRDDVSQVEDDAAAEDEASAPDPLAEVLALDAQALLKEAGAAAVREAAAADDPGLRWEVAGGVLVLDLTALGSTCRWVAGAGFGGMVSDLPERRRRAVHLLALAVLRAEHGVPLPWPGAVTPSSGAPADAGPLLDAVEATLHHLVATGLSHLTSSSTERLQAQTVSARTSGLPRLAGQLRGVAGTLALLERRDHRADVGDALAALARTHALVDALRATADGTGDAGVRRALEGRLRRDFDEGTELHLLPLGLHWWTTRGGARGLTLSSWDLDEGRVVQAVLARPDGRDTSFTLATVVASGALWPGATSPARFLERSWVLERPRLSDDGRVAVGGGTRARPGPVWAADDPRLAAVGTADWDAVADDLRARAGLTGGSSDAILLRPAVTRSPVLDEIAQQLVWVVEDAAGRTLRLTIPVGPGTHHRMEQLVRVVAADAAPVAVLVQVDQVGAGTALVPVAVLREAPGRAGGRTLQVVALDVAREPERRSPLAGRILRLLQARRAGVEQRQVAAPTGVARLLAPVSEVLETQAATGRPDVTTGQREVLRRAARDLDAVGLATPATAVRAYEHRPAPDALLGLAHTLAVVRALDGLPTDGGR